MQFLLAFKNKRPVPGLQNDLQLFAATEELDAGVLTRQVIVSDDTAMEEKILFNNVPLGS